MTRNPVTRKKVIKTTWSYTEYVRHCLRFYARYPEPNYRTAAEMENWKACDRVMTRLSDCNRETLLKIYSDGDTLADSVYKASVTSGVRQDTIWKMVRRFEKEVARERGLL